MRIIISLLLICADQVAAFISTSSIVSSIKNNPTHSPLNYIPPPLQTNGLHYKCKYKYKYTSFMKASQRQDGNHQTDDYCERSSTTSLNDNDMSRRTILSVLQLPLFLTVLTNQPEPSNAAKAKGAAEYDLEFYVRNLIKGNNDKEGNIQASAPPPLPASRTLAYKADSSFIESIINDDLSNDCIALRTLSKITGVPVREIAEMVKDYRTKFSKSFGTRAKWQQELIVDEYYFDLTCYALYRTAATLMPSDYKRRSDWVELLGEEIYNSIAARSGRPERKPSKLTETIPIMVQILECFQANNFVTSFRLGDKNDDFRSGLNIFDSYDDDDIEAGITLNCLISLIRPATLTSSLQIVGEGSRFLPEFVGTAIAAMWRKELGLQVEYETYFVDEEYRPNPKDFFPAEELFQYSIKKK
jgi:hypothetical protein